MIKNVLKCNFFLTVLIFINTLHLGAQDCSQTTIDFYEACNGFPQGRITVTPQGVAPFQIIFPNAVNNINLVDNLYASNYTFNRLPPDNYPITIRDANNCEANFNVLISNTTSPTLSITSTVNTNCKGEKVLCDYEGPSILINEISIFPRIGNGSIYTGVNSMFTQNYGQGEWIELFNPNKCNSIDVSGYILGTYNSFSNSQGMGYLIPENTIIPPNGFLVLRGRRALVPLTNAIDIVIDGLNDRMCLQGGESSRFWFQDAGSWLAFYDKNGVVQDAVTWGFPLPSDLNMPPCLPVGSSLPQNTILSSFNESNGSFIGNPRSGFNFVRKPDGGPWSNTLAREAVSVGSCNVPGQCNPNQGSSTCNGTATVTVTGGKAPYSYKWNDALSQTTAEATNLCAGTYKVIVTDANGCIAEIEVVVEDEFYSISTQINPLMCEGSVGSITLNPNVTRNYQYTWTPNISNNTEAQILTSGEFSVNVTDGQCEWDTTINMQYKPIPDIDISVNHTNGCIPFNPSIEITNFNNQAEYFWSSTPGDTISSNKISINYSIPGKYNIYLKVINEFGCEKDTIFSELFETFDLPTPNLGSDVTICADANEVTFDAGVFTSYVWSSGETTQSIVKNTAGEYILSVTNDNGCVASDTINLIINPLPIPNLGEDVSICADANEVTFDAGDFASYAWNTGATTQTIETKTAGEYIVAVTDNNGCSKNDTVNLIVNPIPTTNLGADVTICADANEVTFDAGTFASYAWNTGATTQTIQTKTAGEYIVTVTDVNGCTQKDTVNLIVNPLPTPNLGTDVIICEDANEVTFDAGTFASYAWNTGNTNQTIQTITAGQYFVRVTDANGCNKNDTVNLIVNLLPTPNLGTDVIICEDANEVTFDAGTFALYAWNTGTTTQTIQTKTAGEYIVTVTDVNGCTQKDTVNLIVNLLPTPNLGTDVIICEDANEVTFDAGTFNSYAWNTGATSQTIQTKTADEYIVTVKDNNGCSKNDTVNLIVNPIPTPNLGADVTICTDANEVTFDAGTFNSYAWNTGTTNQTIQTKTAGEYIVTVTDVNGCTKKDTVNLIVNQLPTPNLGPDVTICEDANEVTFDAGTFNSYAWNTGTTTQTIQTKTAGEYIVTVTDVNGCTKKDTVNLIVNPIPTPNLGADVTICADANEVTFDAGTFAFYAWNTGTTTQTIQTKTAGEYIVTVTDVNGCTKNDTVNLIVNPIPTPNLGNDTAICIGSNPITFTPGNFATYLWNNSETNFSIQTNTAGIYNVTVTDNNGCIASDTIELFVNPLPSPNLGADVNICADANEVTFDAGTFTSYAWSNGATTQTIQTKTAGEYIVAVTDNNGCSKNDTVNLIVNPIPTPNLGADVTICSDANEVTFDAGTFASYSWNTGATTQTIQTKNAGDYIVTVLDANGCTKNDTVNLIVNQLPTPKLQKDTAICIDAPAITLNPGNYAEYLWSTAATSPTIDVNTAGQYIVGVKDINGCVASDTFNLSIKTLPIVDINDITVCPNINANFDAGTFTAYLWHDGSSNASFSTTDSMKVWVTVTDNNGCKNSDTARVFIKNQLDVNLGADIEICLGESAILDAGNLYNNPTYVWSTSETTQTISVNTFGEYFVEVTDQDGCKGYDTLNVIVHNLPTPKLQNDTAICIDAPAITLNPGNYVEYLWSTAATSPTINVNTAGQYIVGVKDINGCVASDTFNLSIKTLPIVDINDITVCPNITANFNAGNFAVYEWHDGSSNATFNTTDSIKVWVVVTDNNGCKNSDTARVFIKNQLDVNLGADIEICLGESAILDAGNLYHNPTYVWNTSAHTQTISVNTSGEYFVEVTDQDGCKGSDTINVLVHPNPTIDIGNDAEICSNATHEFAVTGTWNQIKWSTGANTPSIEVTNQNQYWVEVMDNNNCLGRDTVQLVVHSNPQPSIGVDQWICPDEIATFNAGNFSSYLWHDGSTTSSYTSGDSSLVWVEVRNQFNCVGRDTAYLRIHPRLTVDLGPDQEICSGESYTIQTGLNAQNHTFTWSNNSTTANINVNKAGSYTVNVTNTNGCKANDEILITVNANPTPTVADATVCEGTTAVLNGGTYHAYEWRLNGQSNVLGTNQTFNPITEGVYSLTVTDDKGCKGTTQATVNVILKPVIPSIPDLFACEGENVLAQPNLPNGSVLWSNGSTSRSQFLNTPGKYWITVSSAPNCNATDTFDFIWRTLPEVDLGDDFGFCIGESANISVPNGFSNVLWNTGAKTNTITVNTTGTYIVTVTDNFGCKGTSAINVNVSNLPNFTRTPNQVVCFEEIGSLDLEVNSSLRNNIVWINDFSTINKLTVANAGSYIFTVTNFDGCSKSDTILITERCTPRIFVPNAITPNGDGINDYFTAKGIAISNFEMYIFSRWGEEIYYTNEIEKGWDGTYMGNVVHVDVYVYKIYYTLDDKAGEYKREQMVGTVTVLR